MLLVLCVSLNTQIKVLTAANKIGPKPWRLDLLILSGIDIAVFKVFSFCLQVFAFAEGNNPSMDVSIVTRNILDFEIAQKNGVMKSVPVHEVIRLELEEHLAILVLNECLVSI